MPGLNNHYYKFAFAAFTLSLPILAAAAPFGSSDPRSAAMGKTGVAAIDNTSSAYFNPALLAAFPERKHSGNQQRIALPAATAFASNSAKDLIDLDDQNYDQQIADAVADYNATQNTADFIDVLQSLDEDLNQTSAQPLAIDAQASIVFRIPDRHEGGAFYFSRRAIVDGVVDYSDDDSALINDYLEELEFVQGGGAPATLHPELYNNGALIDPVDNLTSAADAAGLVIEEMGLSMAWQVTLWDTDMMLGMTPKVARVTAYEYSAVASSGDLTEDSEYDNEENVNLDLGWAQQVNDNLMVGLAIKNLIKQEYRTASNNFLTLEPQVRIGSAYRSRWGNFTIDVDLLENAPLYSGDPTQEIGFGGEWTVWNQSLRAGVVKNLAATGDNAGALFTFGLHFQLSGLFTDFSYGKSDSQEMAAFQLGIQF